MIELGAYADNSWNDKVRWRATGRGASHAHWDLVSAGNIALLCWTSAVLLIICNCRGAEAVHFVTHASQAHSAPYLQTDSVPIEGTIGGAEINYFQLNSSTCKPAGYLNVEAFNLDRQGELVGTSVTGKAGLMLMVNKLGEAPVAIPVGSGLWKWNDGTVADYTAYRLVRSYQLLHVAMSENQEASSPWIVGLLNDNSWANLSVNYVLKAWCSKTPACPMDCRGVGRCTAAGTCQCEPGRGGRGCGAIVESIQDGQVIERELVPGGWNYFLYNLTEPNKNYLVEMRRSRGDPVLFVKQKQEGYVPGGVPTVFDFSTYADASSFRERLDHHFVMREEVEPALLSIGVFNNDIDFKEPAVYTIRARSVPKTEIGTLCPLNCSYPHGGCSAVSNRSQCICRNGYDGRYCEGTFTTAELNEPVRGSLNPGQWAFVKFSFHGSPTKNLLITFQRIGGHAILTAKREGIPTLEDNDYRFTTLEANGSLTSYFSMYNGALQNFSYYFAIYNMDYYVHTPCGYTLTFSVADGSGASFTASPLIAIILAVAASVSLCICMGICRSIILHHQRRLGLQRNQGDQTNTGLDPKVVATFPLVPFHETLFSAKEDAQCPVCLGEYEATEVLCRLPKCSHYFHIQCIDAWLKKHTTCPLCRMALQAAPAQSPPPSIPVILAEESFEEEQLTVEVCNQVSNPAYPLAAEDNAGVSPLPNRSGESTADTRNAMALDSSALDGASGKLSANDVGEVELPLLEFKVGGGEIRSVPSISIVEIQSQIDRLASERLHCGGPGSDPDCGETSDHFHIQAPHIRSARAGDAVLEVAKDPVLCR